MDGKKKLVPETPELDKEGVKQMVLQLWQVTQTAPQAAQVHIQCQQIRDQLLAFIDKG